MYVPKHNQLEDRTALPAYMRAYSFAALARAEEIRANLPRTSVPKMLGSSEEEKRFIRYWLPDNAQRQLYCLRQAIRKESEPMLRNVAWAAFSALIIAKATSVSYAIDIPRSRPHKNEDREIDSPFDLWNRRFTQVVNRLPLYASMARALLINVDPTPCKLPMVE
ncbi:MAG: hypothetical protein EPO19_12080 [Betaproteobacteria bacterium]|nr:MAG: hypothetical protein EPO19_12080 [Betaproteobacteria bacterium]